MLIYPSRPASDADVTARSVVLTGIKMAKPAHLARVGLRLAEMESNDPVRQRIPPDAVLVPVPRSAPLVKNGVWPSRAIAEAMMVAHGVGQRVDGVGQAFDRRPVGLREGTHHASLSNTGRNGIDLASCR